MQQAKSRWEVTIRDVVIRDIKTTTVSQIRDVHIREKNNQGLHFTRIAINSRDVIFKDRFMLAPKVTAAIIQKLSNL